jgi:CelD/BcsL family acetyltransferase involved in cellulose biosynthesis
MPAARHAWDSLGHAPRPAISERSSFAVSDGSRLVVEVLDEADAGRCRDAWADLQTRCLEPNVFLDLDFALPAARHLSARPPSFILVWAPGTSGARELVAVCPVTRSRNPFTRLFPVWYHDLAALGFPLLDRTRGGAALQAMLDWVGQGTLQCSALLFRSVPSEGPTAALLLRAGHAAGGGVAVLDSWSRAVLRRDAQGGRSGLEALSAKGAKEARRQRRRLAERGTLGYASARVDDDLTAALEQFLALEARGWKGAAGTALLARPARAVFARTMTRLLGRRGRCRIDSLTLDGIPIAMAVVLTAGDTDFFWKMAYAEDLAQFSPGVQLVLDMTEAQAREGGAAMTDSCAVPHHPMIDRLWRDRLALSDIAVATGPGRMRGFRFAIGQERMARRLKAEAKRAVGAWRRRVVRPSRLGARCP